MSSNLMSFDAPYVHSNLANLSANIGGGAFDVNSQEGLQRIEKQIAELESIKSVLKAEADAFLGGVDYNSVFSLLNSNEATLSSIGREILNEPVLINIVSGKNVNYNLTDLQQAFPGIISNSANSVLNQREAVQLVASSLMQKIGGITVSAQQIDKLNDLLYQGSKEGQIKLKDFVKGRLSSEKGKITALAKEELQKRSKVGNAATATKNNFIKYFRSRFLEKSKAKLHFTRQNEVEEYLQRVESEVWSLKDEVFTFETSSMTGKLGEDFFRIINISDQAFSCEINLTGMMNEETIVNKFKTQVAGKLQTYHKASAESQTDMLITNYRNGKTIRAQAKNLQAAYQSVISSKPFPGMAQLQGETSYKSLVQDFTKISDSDKAALSYLLANEVWFRGGRSMGWKGVSSQGSTLNYITQVVEQILSQEITNFIGINIDNSIDVTASAASSSNVFYIISNTVLFPVWMVIDELIKKLRNETAKFSNFKVSLVTSGIKFGYGPKSFHQAKADKVDRLDPSRNYTDAGLVGVGKEMGSNIISQLQVRKIGLSFNMQNLLSSSFVF